MAGIGHNLVPWQLGPMTMVRIINLRGERVSFAAAYDLLAFRCVTIPRDFFHALLGIVNSQLTVKDLSMDNEHTAMLQIAQSCLTSGTGDYSPIFMIPDSAHQMRYPIQRNGYLDLDTFAIGVAVKPPKFTEIKLRSGNPVFGAENIGTVTFARRQPGWSEMGRFYSACKLTLEFMGLDIDAFIITVGIRLFGQMPDRVFAWLSKENRRPVLQDLICELYDTAPDEYREDIGRSVADVMELSNTALNRSMISPIDIMGAHGGTMHLNRSGALVGVDCSRCHGRFLIRAGLLEPPSQILGAVAYRIPGLKYVFTHEGGAGILVKDSRIVGRFIWGMPTCNCPKLEEVEVQLGRFPKPKQNKTEYGHHPNRGV